MNGLSSLKFIPEIRLKAITLQNFQLKISDDLVMRDDEGGLTSPKLQAYGQTSCIRG